VWFRHADIANGGTLEVTMNNVPNTQLGSADAEFPPASIVVKPEEFEGIHP